MRTTKSLAAGVGAGTSIIAAGSIALASVSAWVGFNGWPEVGEVPVPEAIAVATKLGGDAVSQATAASGAGLVIAAGDVPGAVGDTAAERRSRTSGRGATGDERPASRGADTAGVAGSSASAGRRPGAATPSTTSGGGSPGGSGASRTSAVSEAVREVTKASGGAVTQTGSATAATADALVPGAGRGVEETTTAAGSAVGQVGASVGAIVQQTSDAIQSTSTAVGQVVQGTTSGTVQGATSTAGSAVQQTTTTVTQTVGGILRPR